MNLTSKEHLGNLYSTNFLTTFSIFFLLIKFLHAKIIRSSWHSYGKNIDKLSWRYSSNWPSQPSAKIHMDLLNQLWIQHLSTSNSFVEYRWRYFGIIKTGLGSIPFTLWTGTLAHYIKNTHDFLFKPRMQLLE